MFGDPTFGGASALWELWKKRPVYGAANPRPDISPNYRVPGRGGAPIPETEAQRMQRIREANPEPLVAHGYPMALRSDEHGMYGQAQKDVAAGKYAPEEEDDEMQKLLRYMFMSELMAGMAGGDPPTPYTVQAGPAARAFPTMPSMMG